MRNPTDYLNADNFATPFDAQHIGKYDKEQYETGLKYGRDSHYVFISYNGTWGASMKDGGQLTTYEKIGYHACTKDLWKGILDSGTPIRVYHDGSMHVVRGETENN